jgi:TRAP-type transport system small permease protein
LKSFPLQELPAFLPGESQEVIMQNNFESRILKILDRAGRFDVYVSSISMFIIVLISVWGVITRYVLGKPAGWVEELSLGLFVWLTFFGISILARRGELVSIEFLLNLLPDKLSIFIKRSLATGLMAGSLCIVIYFGFELSLFSTDRYTAILRIPFSIIYAGIPIGSVFTLYHVLRAAAKGPQYLEQVDEEEIVLS